jgi:hypothetical protein
VAFDLVAADIGRSAITFERTYRASKTVTPVAWHADNVLCLKFSSLKCALALLFS